MAGLIYYHLPYALNEKQCTDPLCSFGCCHDFGYLKKAIESEMECTFGKCQTQHKCKRYQCISHEDCNVYLKLRLGDNVVTAEMTAQAHSEKLLHPTNGMHPFWIKEVDRLILENKSTKRVIIEINEMCLLPEMRELAALAPTMMQVQSRRKHIMTKINHQSDSDISYNANKRTIYSDATVLFEGRFGKVIKRKHGMFEVVVAHTDDEGNLKPVLESWDHIKVSAAVNECTEFFKSAKPLSILDDARNLANSIIMDQPYLNNPFQPQFQPPVMTMDNQNFMPYNNYNANWVQPQLNGQMFIHPEFSQLILSPQSFHYNPFGPPSLLNLQCQERTNTNLNNSNSIDNNTL
jgi:hypothetical protein